MNLADLGLRSAAFQVGLLPTDVFGKMRQLQASVLPLDADIRTRGSQLLRDAWGEWLSRWKAFYEKYAPDDAWAQQANKLFVLAHTSEVDAEVEGWRKQFSHYYERFRSEAGSPTGPSAPATPVTPPSGSGDKPTAISWWTIGLVGGGFLVLGALAYSFYRTAQRQRAMNEAFVGALPKLLPGPIGETAHVAHTAAASRDCVGCGRPFG